MKIVRFDGDGEYYGKYDELGQWLGPFGSCGICAQYTILSTPQQNGVAEKRD